MGCHFKKIRKVSKSLFSRSCVVLMEIQLLLSLSKELEGLVVQKILTT